MFVDQEVVRKDTGIRSKSFAVCTSEDVTSNDRRSGIRRENQEFCYLLHVCTHAIDYYC